MGNTKEKEWLSVVLLTIAVLGALFFSIDRLFFHGILGACIRLSETHEMALELMILDHLFSSDFYTGEMEKRWITFVF